MREKEYYFGPLLDQKTLRQLPTIETAQSLGLEAVAVARLFSICSDLSIYPVGYDGRFKFFGLLCSDRLIIGCFHVPMLSSEKPIRALHFRRDRAYVAASLRELLVLHWSHMGDADRLLET